MSTNTLSPITEIGSLSLRVKRLDQAKIFYTDLFGFSVQPGSDADTLRLGASVEGPTLLELNSDPQASARPSRTTGLYHVAYLFPNRQALGRVLKHLVQNRWPLHGAADHGVSEAIYLPDMEGNGIEIYVDRPANDWPRNGDQLTMVSEALNLDAILDEAGSRPFEGVDPLTRIGHIHLNVASLENTERFYSTLAGFDVTQRSYQGALFLSAGGYHHHIGTNVWNGRNAPPPPPDSAGMLSYTIRTAGGEDLASLRSRLEAGGFATQDGQGGFTTLDPSGIRVNFTAN